MGVAGCERESPTCLVLGTLPCSGVQPSEVRSGPMFYCWHSSSNRTAPPKCRGAHSTIVCPRPEPPHGTYSFPPAGTRGCRWPPGQGPCRSGQPPPRPLVGPGEKGEAGVAQGCATRAPAAMTENQGVSPTLPRAQLHPLGGWEDPGASAGGKALVTLKEQ